MKQVMKMMITAMLAIAMVFSAFVIVLPGESQASSVDDNGTIMFNVIGTDGYFINGATWKLNDLEYNNTVATGLTSNGGLGQIGSVPLANYVLWVNSTTTDLSSKNIKYDPNAGFSFEVVTLDRTSSKTGIMGYLSASIPNTSVQVFDATYSQETVALTGNSFYAADLADGDYVVLIRVPGYLPVMANVSYDASGITSIENLTESNFTTAAGNAHAIVVNLDLRDVKVNRTTAIIFGADYNNFSYQKTENNSFEVYKDALPIRMQIDQMGISDGLVTADEVAGFIIAKEAINSKPVTNDFLKVNGVAYNERAGSYNVTLLGLVGSAFSTDNYQIIRNVEYESQSNIAANESSYSSSLKAVYDTADVNEAYLFDLPIGYELNSQVSKTQYVNIESENYNLFVVNPIVRDGSVSEYVNMTFSMAGVPTASGTSDPSDYAYAVNVKGVLQHYIVGKGQIVTFNASSSTDANGNPLANYVWNFGDGTPVVNITEPTVQHTFNTASAAGYNVTLMVINQNGNISEETSFKVLVDGVKPNAEITTVTANPSAGSITSFSGMNSTDDIIAGDKLGTIAKWIWNFGDNTANVTKTSDNGNVTKTFENNGTYNVTLTVVDVAGNSQSVLKNVTVQRSEMASLSIQSVTFSPEAFEEGAEGIISVVVKNSGEWEASSFTVNIYKVVGTETVFLTREVLTTPLAPGENTTVNITYAFAAQGDYRLKVSVEDDDARTSDSNFYGDLTVSEAGWKNIAIFVGVIVVVGVIVALVYYRNRLPGKNAFKKGGAPAKQDKTIPRIEESSTVEEPKKKSSSGSSGKSKKR